MNEYSIEAAYSVCHQKGRIYAASNIESQKDDIEYAIAEYVNGMNPELYKTLSNGRKDFLLDHKNFANDIQDAVDELEKMMK